MNYTPTVIGLWSHKPLMREIIQFNVVTGKKLDYDQKTVTAAEAKSTLTLEEAITRWVGMDVIKSKFDAHNIK